MGRPTKAEAERLLVRMQQLVARGMSVSEIARATNKSAQAVSQYLNRNSLRTQGMLRYEKNNLDKVTGGGEGARVTD